VKKRAIVIVLITSFLFITALYSPASAEYASGIAVTVTVESAGGQAAGVDLRVFPGRRLVRSGRNVSILVIIRNTGDGVDNFSLTASSSLGWTVGFPKGDTVGPIKPNRRKVVRVTVSVPADAKRRETDTVTFTATSQYDPLVSDSASSTLIVRR